MARTRNDIIKRALQRLRIIPAGEQPNADDGALVADVWVSVRQELVNAGVSIVSDNSIPDDLFEGCADLLAARVATDFGVAAMPDAEAAAYRKIFKMGGDQYDGSRVQATYF